MKDLIRIAAVSIGVFTSSAACSGDGVMGVTKAVPGINRSQSISVAYEVNGFGVSLQVPGGGALVSAAEERNVVIHRTQSSSAQPTVIYERKYDQLSRGNTTGAFRIWVDVVSIPEAAGDPPANLAAFGDFVNQIASTKRTATVVSIGGHDWIKREVSGQFDEVAWLYSRPLDSRAYLTIGFKVSAERSHANPAWLSDRQADVLSVLASTRISPPIDFRTN